MKEMGIKITFHSCISTLIPFEEAQEVLMDIKNQIRERKDPLDRSEHWEGYEIVKGAYENAPHLDAHVYSFDKERRVLMSRMNTEEKRDLGWIG